MAAETSGDESALVLFVVQAFLWISTLYPITLFFAIWKYRKADSIDAKRKAVSLPYKHIGLAVLFLFFWMLIGE
jgi:hypothetical protein